jgi:dihydropteroate synthase
MTQEEAAAPFSFAGANIPSVWQAGRFQLDLTAPLVMGIVNVTPDSFSDGGYFDTPRLAQAYCEHLVREGAHLLDIGAESTRPGARPVPADEEWRRLQPVLSHAVQLGVPVSVDTYKPEIMRAALDLGADVINDVWALRQGDALQALAAYPKAGVVLMHMHGEPATMQVQPMEDDPATVALTVGLFLQERLEAADDAGIGRQRIVLDPGIGFGKTVAQNFALLAQQSSLLPLGQPLLCAWSRKSSLGQVTARSVGERLPASLAATVLALERGARVVRTHDVPATLDAVKVWLAAAQ